VSVTTFVVFLTVESQGKLHDSFET